MFEAGSDYEFLKFVLYIPNGYISGEIPLDTCDEKTKVYTNLEYEKFICSIEGNRDCLIQSTDFTITFFAEEDKIYFSTHNFRYALTKSDSFPFLKEIKDKMMGRQHLNKK
jgi:hypothetical protein